MVVVRGFESRRGEAGSMEDDRSHERQREQPPTGLRYLYDQKKKAARKVLYRARRSMEDKLYRKLDEDGGKKMIFNSKWHGIELRMEGT